MRILQWLVIGLTASLILGVITVVAVVVTRFPQPDTLALPAELQLPEGTKPISMAQGRDWVGIVTEADTILIYDRQSGALRQTVTLTRP